MLKLGWSREHLLYAKDSSQSQPEPGCGRAALTSLIDSQIDRLILELHVIEFELRWIKAAIRGAIWNSFNQKDAHQKHF